MYAHGVENRFADWSLDRVFGDLRRFVTPAQWQQFRALKYEIESMRRKPQLAGYVITELHDCHWESNGLLDMRRNPRVFHELFHIINSDTVIVPKWDRTSYWSGETAKLQVAVAHGAGPVLEGCQLEITLGDETKRLPLPRIEAPSVLDLGAVELPVPSLPNPACVAWRWRSAPPTGSSWPRTISTSPFSRREPVRLMRASSSGPRTRTFVNACRRSATARRGRWRKRPWLSRARTTRPSPTMCARARGSCFCLRTT